MREICEIIEAYECLCAEDKPCALATVIRVEGSSYRRPGAKMLIAEDGRTWGGVSGGCLERDVARRARQVIATGKPLTSTYDSDDEDFDFPGTLATGCGGTIHLFIQPLSPQSAGPLNHFNQAVLSRQPVWIATVVEASRGCSNLIGTTISPAQREMSNPPERTLQRFLATRIARRTSQLNNHYELARRAIGAEFVVLAIECIAPPLSLIIFGEGPDVAPLLAIAKITGWHTTVIGVHSPDGLRRKFPQADIVCCTSRDDPTAGVEIRPVSAVVVMTHNVHRDRLILEHLPKRLQYLGILGPRHRTRRLIPQTVDHQTLFAPIGLDLGSRTPQEIALSIVAEIQAVTRHATAGFLRNKPGPINDRQTIQSGSPRVLDIPFDERAICPIQAY